MRCSRSSMQGTDLAHMTNCSCEMCTDVYEPTPIWRICGEKGECECGEEKKNDSSCAYPLMHVLAPMRMMTFFLTYH